MSGKGKKGKKAEVVEVKKDTQKFVKKELPKGTPNVMEDLNKRQAFKKFSYRGYDINKLLAMNMDEVAKNFRSRQRRRLRRQLKPAYGRLIAKLSMIKQYTASGDKPFPVKTHLRDTIVLPSMVMSNINVHSGKAFNAIEVKPDMVGYYLGEFAQTYKRVGHGKAGVGSTGSSKFKPLK